MGRIPLCVLVLVVSSGVGVTSAAGRAGTAGFGVACASTADAGAPYLGGINCRTLDVDGYPRHYIVYVPPSAEAKMGSGQQVPLVLMLHGTSGDGAKFFQISGW